MEHYLALSQAITCPDGSNLITTHFLSILGLVFALAIILIIIAKKHFNKKAYLSLLMTCFLLFAFYGYSGRSIEKMPIKKRTPHNPYIPNMLEGPVCKPGIKSVKIKLFPKQLIPGFIELIYPSSN